MYTGKVWLKQAPLNIAFDPTTRTLSWDNYLILPITGGQGRIKLAPGSYTFTTDPFNVAYLDLSAALTTGDTPATAVKGGAYYSTAADRFRGLPNQIPMFFWNGSTDYGPVDGFPKLAIATSTLAEDDLVVKVGVNTVSAYAKGAKNGSLKYLEQTIGYENRPFDPSGSDAFGNSDLWRLKHMYETDINLAALSFARTRGGSAILNGGEIVGAWLEQGMPDYIGGYHGDEIKTYVALLLDGVEIALDSVTTLVGKKLEFVQHSKLYRCNTQVEIATHSQRVELTRSEGGMKMELTQRVVWGAAVTLSASMMTMLPIKRLLNDTSGDVITDTGFRAPYAGVENMAATGFPQVATLGELPDCQLWGPTGIAARVEMLEHPGFLDCGFFFSNALFYNKAYFSVAGSTVSGMGGTAHVTTPGERWDVKSVIHLTTKL
jgi:hypothetical protein